jgi:peptidyl-tRNA hydrolase
MYCVFSKESLKKMNGIRGKIASQAGHAFLHAYWNSLENFTYHAYAEAYKKSGKAVKITCVVDTDAELLELYDKYKSICGVTKVEDAGDTVFNGEKTLTCIGIGPFDVDLFGKPDLKILT